MNKKYILILVLLSTPAMGLFAQKDTAFGKNYVTMGLGYPNLGRLIYNVYQTKENFESKGIFTYHLKYENRVKSWLGIGLSINHMTYQVNFSERILDTAVGVIKNNKIEISNNNTAFNLRANFHFINPEKNDKWDIYVGLGIGYKFGKFRIKSDYPEETFSIELPSASRIGAEITAGCRYFFDKNIGLYLEAGPAKSLVQLGVSTRF